jgi:hypothetical protein
MIILNKNFTKKILFGLFVLSFLSWAIYSLADFDIKKWRYEKEIKIEGINLPTYALFPFDEEVFANAKPNLADIRVIAGSEGVPYKLLVEKEYYTREFHPTEILNRSFIPGEYQLFIVDLRESGILHNQIKILTTSVNFRREIIVEGSNDQENWFILNDEGHIYDYSPPKFEFKQQDTSVDYPESTYRYLKITIMSKGEEPLEITGAEIYRQVTITARKINYPTNIINQGIDEEHRVSFIIVDLGSSGLPSNSLQIKTTDTNFSREVALEGSNDNQNWRVVEYRDVIFSFSTPKFTGSKLTIDYPESNFRYLKLTIFNKDDKPINITGASVSGILRKVLFKYDPGENYKLYYGNPEARYPQYDIEALFPYLEIKDLPQAVLGAQTNNPLFEEILPPPPPFTERYSWLLIAVLVVIVLILLWLVVRLILATRRPQLRK